MRETCSRGILSQLVVTALKVCRPMQLTRTKSSNWNLFRTEYGFSTTKRPLGSSFRFDESKMALNAQYAIQSYPGFNTGTENIDWRECSGCLAIIEVFEISCGHACCRSIYKPVGDILFHNIAMRTYLRMKANSRRRQDLSANVEIIGPIQRMNLTSFPQMLVRSS